MDPYIFWLTLMGAAALGAAMLPRLADERPLSVPIVYVAAGVLVFRYAPGLPVPDPLRHSAITERLTEMVVIVSLMGAGLKIDRPPSWRGWQSTWRLLAITMPLTIAATAFLGWWVVGFVPATALLFGALIAPTDPVLAAEVQVGEPLEETRQRKPEGTEEREVRFALTSEAGLNDGLAFPFTNLAIAAALAVPGSETWLRDWFAVDVLRKLGVGMLAGWLGGRSLGWFIFRSRVGQSLLVREMEGSVALALTLLVYGLTEALGGYGFLAVFVGAVTLRNSERDHEYHMALHHFAEVTERLLMALLMLLFGGALASGLLRFLTWDGAVVGLAVLLVIRPLAGVIGLIGCPAAWTEKLAIGFFGIRGVGSLYYLAYALNHAEFEGARPIWSLAGFIILVSIVLHGVTAGPVMRYLERCRP